MKNKKSITILMVAFTLASCQSYKRVPYLQSYESLTDKGYKEIVINEVNQQDTLYDARIQPKDLLSITVNTSDPQAAAPFNLTMQTSINVAQANSTYVTSQPTLQQYLVNNEGEIDFPVIGKLKIGGLTKTAAEKLVREQLRPYLKETPIVTVRMSNYKISVIGEVNHPGTFTINNEKVNLFEALAMAGDMYNPQIQISAESETKRSIFREKDKTKRSKKESAQHSKSRNKSFVMTSVSAL